MQTGVEMCCQVKSLFERNRVDILKCWDSVKGDRYNKNVNERDFFLSVYVFSKQKPLLIWIRIKIKHVVILAKNQIRKSAENVPIRLSQGFGNVIVLYYITNFWLEVSWQNDLFRALSEILNVKKTKTLRVLKFYWAASIVTSTVFRCSVKFLWKFRQSPNLLGRKSDYEGHVSGTNYNPITFTWSTCLALG